jgi:uncharacterized protein YegP (UPF0339 family)
MTDRCAGENRDQKAGIQNTPMTYWIYKDAQNEWRWYLEAANNRKIANSGEGYKHEADCQAAIFLVKGSNGAPVKKKP